MVDEAINFNVSGAERVTSAANSVGDAFQRLDSRYSKLTSNIGKSVVSSGMAQKAGANFSLSNGIGNLPDFQILGVAARGLVSAGPMLSKLTGLNKGTLLSNVTLTNFGHKIVEKSSNFFNKIGSSIEVSVQKQLMRFRSDAEKNLMLRGIGKRRFAGGAFDEFTPIFSLLSRFIPKLAGMALGIGVGVLSLAGMGILLDRRVQDGISNISKYITDKWLTPTMNFISTNWESLKAGIQRGTGGLIQSQSLNVGEVQRKELEKLVLPSEIKNYYAKSLSDTSLTPQDPNGYLDRVAELEKIVMENNRKYNEQIDSIISNQKYKARK